MRRGGIVFVAVWLSSVVSVLRAQNVAELAYHGMQQALVKGSEDGPATGKPKVRHSYAAAQDVLAIVVDTQHVWAEPLVKYEKQPGDEIRRTRPQNYGTNGHQFFWGRTLYRNGEVLGDMVGPNEDYYAPVFKQQGEPLDTTWADASGNYSITSKDDHAFATAVNPIAVYRKSKPETYEWVGGGVQKASNRHEIYLRLPRALTPGCVYEINWNGNAPFSSPLTVTFDDSRLRTEAIQVNQIGYHSRQLEKVACVSMWLGSGGGVNFDRFKQFWLVDDQTGQQVFEGVIILRHAAVPGKEQPPEKTDEPTDDLPTPVYQLDFSSYDKPGTYRVVVPGLGSSFPFRIDENVWRDAALVSAKGFYNQRSGIALGPPYSDFTRPRDLHPADGVRIYKTDPGTYFAPTPALVKLYPTTVPTTRPSAFQRIQASIVEDQTEPNAWGGWHDAADYDRDILPQEHLQPVHALLDIYDSSPAYFEKLNLNLPESSNNIPDIVDEALWCTELWLRLQQPDGGVPSAVESIEHPSEPSWMLGQPTAVTPPTPAGCQMWVAAAARMSMVLEKYDPARAKVYRESALRAMTWADNNASVQNVFGRSSRPTAALWLFRLTGDQAWHKVFKDSSAQNRGMVAGRVYALMPDNQTDPALRQQCRDALLKSADAKVDRTARWTWHLGPQRFNWDERLGQSGELMFAHRLTGDSKYIHAMEQQAQFALGLNPNNASYTTGLGSRQTVVFNLEARYLGAAYPHGITSYGPAPRNIWRGEVIERTLTAAGIYPAWKDWPWAESNFNMRSANINEYTISNMGNILATRAYLAQYYAALR